MDDLYVRYRKGVISKQMYKNSAVEKTIQHLQKSGYTFVRSLGSGGYGTVVEFKNQTEKSSFAMKIVLKEAVSDGEQKIWPGLQNDNILKLLSVQSVDSARTYVFTTPAQPYTLHHLLTNRNFLNNIMALDTVTVWLKDVICGFSYLHKNNCYHLDLKYNNVLISAQNRALICDFTFLTQTDDFVTG